MAQELATPFPLVDAPLARAVLMHEENNSTIIFSAHHSIADGLSIAFVLRDLLEALSGKTLRALPVARSQEELCEMIENNPAESEPQRQPQSTPLRKPAQLLNRNRSTLTVQGLCLSAETTAKLRERARRERTTVYGALAAALILAGRQLFGKWREEPVRVISPVSTRKALELNEECVLSILFPVNAYDPQGVAQFWDTARIATYDLAGARTRHGAAIAFNALRQLMSNGPDVPAIAEFELQACACEMMLSNLGVLPFDTDYGGLTLKALWGPSVFVGIEGQQMIGAATLHGTVHLLHSSYTPIPDLLKTTERILFEVLG